MLRKTILPLSIVVFLFGLLSVQVSLASNGVHILNHEDSTPQPSISDVNQNQATRTVYLPILRYSPPPTIYGIEMQSLNAISLNQASQAGASWTRRNAILWSQVEPVKGQRNWSVLSGLETELIRAADQGVQVILIIRSTPAWAAKVEGSPCGPIIQTEFATFANFVYEAVQKYSRPPYNVKYWEIGNEPDNAVQLVDLPYGCWGDYQDDYYGGGYYADMLKQVYPQVKAANPQAQVLIGGLLMNCDPINPPINPSTGNPLDCRMSNFLEGILLNGGSNSFDGIAFHAYDSYQYGAGEYINGNWHSAWNTTGPSLLAKARFLQSVLNRYNITDKYLVSTEAALLCGSNCGEYFETTKANYVAQVYTLSLALGLRTNIWYDLYGAWQNTGLLYGNDAPRPAYVAFQFNRKELGRASFVQDQSVGSFSIFEFLKDGRKIWVLWSKDGASHIMELTSTPTAIFDVTGKSLGAYSRIQVDARPLYIEW